MAIRIFIFLMLVSFRVACFAQDWSPLGDSLDGYIIGVYNDPITGRLVVNGSFDHIGTLQVDGIASWDGISWSALATGINTSFSPVYSACRFQDTLYTEGLVSPINSGHESVLRLNAGVWEGIGLVHGGISKLKVIGEKMYALGTFDSIGGVEAYSVAAWDGTRWESIGNDLNAISLFPIGLSDIAEYQGDLYIVGKFDDGQGLANIAKLENGYWQSVSSGISTWNGFGADLIVFQELLYVAGFFQEYEGNIASNIMAWSGTEWISPAGGVTFSSGEGGFIRGMTTDGDYLYIAGVFDRAGGLPITELARWDGVNWCGFDVSTNNAAQVLVPYQNKLILAGSYYWVNDSMIPHIAQADYYVDSCGSVGITEVVIDLTDLQLHPNPTTSTTTLTWQGPNQGNCQLSLYDAQGRLVAPPVSSTTIGEWEIDMRGMAPGIYFGRLAVGEETRSFKVVRE